MKPNYSLLLCFGWLLLTTSCEKDIDLKREERTPKLVMNALINSDSIRNILYLNLTGPYRMMHVADATVEVQVNGAHAETAEVLPPPTEGDPQKRFLLTTRFRPGDVVRIDARTDDGLHHAWAEVTVPQPPIINRVDTLGIRKKDEYDHSIPLLRYKIQIQDRPNERNFYRLILDQHTTFADYQQTYRLLETGIISREDIVLTDGQPSYSEDTDLLSPVENLYGVFDDYRFANSVYTMTVYTDDDWDWRYEYTRNTIWWSYQVVNVRLLSITETEYRYLKLLNIIDTGDFDEVTDEQISFPSNVHGGTGLVGISSETSVQVKVLRGRVPQEILQQP